MKKRLVTLFAFVLIAISVCFVSLDGKIVKATESTEETVYKNDDFVSVKCDDISEFKQNTENVPEASDMKNMPEGYEDYLFAGWFNEKECEKEDALKASVKDNAAWAKFVPSGVLSVKSQIKQTSTGSYNMRILSTIDTLNYAEVGFEVQYHNGENFGQVIPMPVKEVYTRIKATAESGVGYNYSPKVVDTKSEYFMTATLLNINATKTDNTFRVVPYWKTLDGTKVYGVNRYITVNDGKAETDAMSFTVKKEDFILDNLSVKTANDASANSKIRKYEIAEDKYATVIVTGQKKTTLASATKYVITDGTKSVNAIYRNLETTHKIDGNTSVNADYSWHTINPNQKEYIIATTADFYGFASKSNEEMFQGKTIYLVADIILNDGENATQWSASNKPTYTWDPIGNNSFKFDGIFDGQMHTVSGIYVSGTTYVGLFQYVRSADAAVKNLVLQNSYFYGTGQVGSIAGRGAGTFDSIYSKAIIKVENTAGSNSDAGGLVGYLVSQSNKNTSITTINNCWFDGSVTSRGTYTGGIVGRFEQGILNIYNCLNTGNITCNYTSNPETNTHVYLAGLCGGAEYTAATLNITDSMNNGVVRACYYDSESQTESENSYLLTAAISVGKNGKVKLTNVFDASNHSTFARKGNGTLDKVGEWKGRSTTLSGCNSYNIVTDLNTKLDYCTSDNPDGEWIIRENDVPALKSFVKDGIDVAWYYDNNTSGNDTFTISTEEELYGLSALSVNETFEGETIYLDADIKVNNGIASEWAEGTATADRTWPMIGRTSATPFKGRFDGNGHTIKGVYMSISDSSTGAGFFGETYDAVIKNFRLSNSAFISETSTAALGSVVGKGDGTLVNIYCDDSVIIDTEKSTTLGGIIGSITKGTGTKATTKCTIENCWFDGKISQDVSSSSHVNVGGIVGLQQYGNNTNDNKLTINNCLYTGEMKTTASFTASKNLRAGGIVGGKSGLSDAVFNMNNCLSNGKIDLTKSTTTGTILAGALFGGASRSETGETYSNVYATTECYTNALGVYPTNKSASDHEAMTITHVNAMNLYGNKAETLDYTYVWEALENDTPKLKYYLNETSTNYDWYVESIGDAADPYLIRTAGELDVIALMTNNGHTSFDGETIKLVENIDYNKGTEDYESVEDWEAAPGLKQWTPIGTATYQFKGTFDGNDVTIKGIYVNSNSLDYVGLFGRVHQNATLKNFKLTDSQFVQYKGVGASVGSIAAEMRGMASNIYSNANIDSASQFTGGIFARANGVDLQQSKVKDETTGITTITYNRNQLSIKDVWFDGEMHVSYQTQDTSYRYVGGIVGIVVQGTVDMENILFTGLLDVVDYNDKAYAGGIVGATMAQVIKNVSNSTVKVYQDDDFTTVNLTSCVSAGVITQPGSQVGSIIGCAESKINTTKDNEDVIIDVYPAPTYVNLTNVFATSECHNQTTHTGSASVDLIDADTQEKNTVTVEGQIAGSVIQSQYNSDRLIGYCTEMVAEEKAPMLDFDTTWTMRTSGVPILSSLKAVVDDSTLIVNPSKLTEEIGLDYWESNLTLKDAVNAGKGNYLLNYAVSNEKTYDGFLNHLYEKGFRKHIDNTGSTMFDDGIYNTTYYKEHWVLNITYTEKLGTVDVTINTFGIDVLSPNLFSSKVKQTEGGTAVQLSMLPLSNNGKMKDYGSSFVFQLPNGHFIIHDGGNSGNATDLISYLKSLTNGDDIYIDAWVISHFHSDHCGVLVELSSGSSGNLREGVYLNALYVNEPNLYAKTEDSGNIVEQVEKALSGVQRFTKAPTKAGEVPEKPDVYRIHTGERYYFDGVTMDVVLAQEQIAPHIDLSISVNTDCLVDKAYKYYGDWDGFNATSTTCVFTVNQPRTDGTYDKIYLGGDSNKANMNYIMQAYDGVTERLVHTKEEETLFKRYTEQVINANNQQVDATTIKATSSKTLSGITTFVALHHGKNTSEGFTQYLFGGDDEALDVVLFPYNQMYEAIWHASHTDDEGNTYLKRYWMEDNSTVFDYRIKDINNVLCTYANNQYYTYGSEDSWCKENNIEKHGTVELTFTSDGITTKVIQLEDSTN